MSRADQAETCFKEGFNCAQAVFSSCSEALGLEAKTARKVACAFGGGMSHCGEACGAVTGALLAIGLKHGKTEAEDNEAKEKTYALGKEFVSRFTARHGSISCKGLLKYDISTDAGLRQAREARLFQSLCPQYVRSAAEIVGEMLGI